MDSGNPMGRNYTAAELRAAASVWPQYEKERERDGRGPLFWGTGKQAWLREIDVLIRKAEKRLEKLRNTRAAVEREWAAPSTGQESSDG